MPAPVDHEARRMEVAEIASHLIATEGPDAVTFRDIAKAAGFSTAIVSHYFRNKRDLLQFVFRAAAQRAVASVEHEMEEGLSLHECLESLLPLTEGLREDWKIWIALWGKATADDQLQAEQQGAQRAALNLIRRLLNEAADGTEVLKGRDADIVARKLLTIVVGIATQVVFDPQDWPPEKQREIIADALRGL